MKQKFAVVHRPDKTSRQLKSELADKLREKGWTEEEQQPDLVFAIGGDGTFLYAVHEYLDQLEKNGSVFTVAVNPDRFPYSYYEDGQIKGILPELFADNSAFSAITAAMRWICAFKM